MNEILPTACSLLLTEQCNLRCKYCFEHHKDRWMNKTIAENSINWLFENAKKANKKTVNVTMFGGEPMLNWEVMQFAFQMGYEKAQKTGIAFSAGIITNATVMSEDIFNMLKKYRDKVKLNVQLSIDGIPEVQDMYRVDIHGNPTWDKVKKNIPIWKKLFEDCADRLNVHGCINHKTIKYLYQNYKFFHDTWGFKKIWYIPVAEEQWTNEDVEIYKNQIDKIYKDVINIVKKNKENLKLINNKLNDILNKHNYTNLKDSFIKSNLTNALNEIYNYAPLDRCFNYCQPMNSKTCGAGVNYVTITADGEVYPCHQIYFNDPNKETLLGNIFTGIDDMKRKIFLEYDAKEDFEGCKDCNHNNCYRCLAANYVFTGSMFSQIKNKYCKMMKVDQYYQKKLREDLVNMGLLAKKNCNPDSIDIGNNSDCLCDCRGSNECNQHNSDGTQYCDVVENIFDTNREQSSINMEESLNIIASGIEQTLNKIDNLEDLIKENL
ncbi:radical SAM protein [Clostridium sp. LBM24168]